MNLDAAKSNIRRIAELATQRRVPFNYAPTVDPLYLVLFPGEENQFVVKPDTRLEDIPGIVFHEFKTFNQAQVVMVEYVVAGDTKFMVFDQEGMAPAEDDVFIEEVHRVEGHNNFMVKEVWR